MNGGKALFIFQDTMDMVEKFEEKLMCQSRRGGVVGGWVSPGCENVLKVCIL